MRQFKSASACGVAASVRVQRELGRRLGSSWSIKTVLFRAWWSPGRR
jgi:hypothetical protein